MMEIKIGRTGNITMIAMKPWAQLGYSNLVVQESLPGNLLLYGSLKHAEELCYTVNSPRLKVIMLIIILIKSTSYLTICNYYATLWN
jgi:hypothetical protein